MTDKTIKYILELLTKNALSATIAQENAHRTLDKAEHEGKDLGPFIVIDLYASENYHKAIYALSDFKKDIKIK